MELAAPRAFAFGISGPSLGEPWYDERRRKRTPTVDCEPNPGHLTLACFQEEFKTAGKHFTLFSLRTVDQLHQRAVHVSGYSVPSRAGDGKLLPMI